MVGLLGFYFHLHLGHTFISKEHGFMGMNVYQSLYRLNAQLKSENRN